MTTTRSILGGIGYAALGIAAGITFDHYMSNVVQGSVPYFNDWTRTMGNLGEIAGILGGLGAGVYEAFFSPRANQNIQPQQGGGQQGNATITFNIRGRNMRNRF